MFLAYSSNAPLTFGFHKPTRLAEAKAEAEERMICFRTKVMAAIVPMNKKMTKAQRAVHRCNLKHSGSTGVFLFRKNFL